MKTFNRDSKSCAHKQSKIRNSFMASHQQTGVQPSPGKQGSITCNGYLGRQMPSFQMPPPSFFFPQPYITEHDLIWYGTSLWSAKVSCPGCVSSQPLVHSQPSLLVGWGERQRRPWSCVSAAQR